MTLPPEDATTSRLLLHAAGLATAALTLTLTTTACRADSPEGGGYPAVAEVVTAATNASVPVPERAYPDQTAPWLAPAYSRPPRVPWSTPRPSRTPDPTATHDVVATETALLASEPVEVGVSRAEAEAEVLRWLDPSREPRIEWSRYVRRHDLVEALRDSQSGHLYDYLSGTPDWSGQRVLDELGDPLLVVVASTVGMDRMYATSDGYRPRLGFLVSPCPSSPERHSLSAVFDGQSGKRVAAQPAGCGWGHEVLEPLTDVRSADIVLAAASPVQSATHTPVATRTPDPPLPYDCVPVTWSNLPAGHRPTFEAYPLAPGTTWTWHVTENLSDLVWETAIVSETVTAACLHDDLVVVESNVVTESLTLPRSLPRLSPTIARRYIAPGIIATSRENIADVDTSDWSRPSGRTPFGQGGVALEFFAGQIPSSVHDVAHTGVVTGPHALDTQLGMQENCWETRTTASARSGSSRWFCTGIGNVQYGDGGCGISGCWTTIANLIDYHIAELPDG